MRYRSATRTRIGTNGFGLDEECGDTIINFRLIEI